MVPCPAATCAAPRHKWSQAPGPPHDGAMIAGQVHMRAYIFVNVIFFKGWPALAGHLHVVVGADIRQAVRSSSGISRLFGIDEVAAVLDNVRAAPPQLTDLHLSCCCGQIYRCWPRQVPVRRGSQSRSAAGVQGRRPAGLQETATLRIWLRLARRPCWARASIATPDAPACIPLRLASMQDGQCMIAGGCGDYASRQLLICQRCYLRSQRTAHHSSLTTSHSGEHTC